MREGSSPLTRGKRSVDFLVLVPTGLIPAHAGKTQPRGRSPRRARAHPRSRGENTTVGTMPGAGPGSSPLTRGKHRPQAHQLQRRGLIPAHAGKTLNLRPLRQPLQAHPRSRGENALPGAPGRAPRGSSPLTRGKPAQLHEWAARSGLIPAHAGKTRGKLGATDPHTAHPRSRGENGVGISWGSPFRGSSPLTRGKRRRLLRPWCRGGLIPAHAGKTLPSVA